jgi:hypothetical protein
MHDGLTINAAAELCSSIQTLPMRELFITIADAKNTTPFHCISPILCSVFKFSNYTAVDLTLRIMALEGQVTFGIARLRYFRSKRSSMLHIPYAYVLTREEDDGEEEEDKLSVDPKRGKTINIYTKEREGKAPCRLPEPEPEAEHHCRC